MDYALLAELDATLRPLAPVRAIFAPFFIWIVIAMVALTALQIGLKLLMKKDSGRPAPTDPGTRLTRREAIGARRVVYGQTRVGGNEVFTHASGNNAYLHKVIALADHEVEEIGDIYFNDELVPLDVDGNATGKYAGGAMVKKKLGTANQTAFEDLVAVEGSGWTEFHKGIGVALIYVRLTHDRDKFPQGEPNVTAVVKGKNDIVDPRDDSVGYSTNMALIIANYLQDPLNGLGCEASEIDEAVLIASADICDELVPVSGGSDEARYAGNGSFTTDAKPVDVLAGMVVGMAGHVVFSAGLWRIVAGAWRAPTGTAFTPSDYRGELKVQTLLSRRDSFNAVKGTFVSPANNYNPTDFPAVTSAAYEAEDGGERVYLPDLVLEWTQSAAAAQRIARILLRRTRQQLTIAVRLSLRAWRKVAGDVLPITDAQMGWSEKAFEVQDISLVLGDGGGEGEMGPLEVEATLRETAEAVYDWSASDEAETDPAPNTTLPDVYNVLPPLSLGVSEELYDTRTASGVKARAVLSWSGSADAFVTAYQPEYRASGASAWTILPRTVGTTANVDDIAPGAHEFRVAAVNIRGVISGYIETSRQIVGLAAAPSAPSGLSHTAIGGFSLLRWAQSADLDVRIGGEVHIRHSALTSAATWADATSILEDPLPGGSTQTSVPLKTGTYLLKFRDSGGTWSAATSIVASQVALPGFTNLASVVEDPAFGGTKTDCVVSGVVLRIDSTGSAVEDDATYTSATTTDLGSVKNVRVTSALEAAIVNEIDTVDARTGNVDDWPDWDGAVSGTEADAWCEVRTTPDNTAGSPTWSAWGRLDVGELACRGIQYRAQLRSYDPSFNIEIAALAFSVDELT